MKSLHTQYLNTKHAKKCILIYVFRQKTSIIKLKHYNQKANRFLLIEPNKKIKNSPTGCFLQKEITKNANYFRH